MKKKKDVTIIIKAEDIKIRKTHAPAGKRHKSEKAYDRNQEKRKKWDDGHEGRRPDIFNLFF